MRASIWLARRHVWLLTVIAVSFVTIHNAAGKLDVGPAEAYYYRVAEAYGHGQMFDAHPYDYHFPVIGIPLNAEHPPLAKWIYGAFVALGADLQTLKLATAVFGASGVVLLYLILTEYTNRPRAALAAGALLSSETYCLAVGYLDFDSLMIFFGMAATYAAVKRHDTTAFILVGCSSSCRIPGLFYIGPVLYLTLRRTHGPMRGGALLRGCGTVAITYALAYTPFLIWWVPTVGLDGAVRRLAFLQFWQLYYHEVKHTSEGADQSVLNWFRVAWWKGWTPAVWGTMAWTLFLRRLFELTNQLPRSPALALALVGFASVFLPLLAMERGGAYIDYVMPSLPFLAMTVTLVRAVNVNPALETQ